jgi:hypothetical protein
MDVIVYERDEGFVIERLQEGEFDYIDSGDELFESDFFRFIQAEKVLDEISATYPTPRKKEEVPLWFYNASNISMRLHGAYAFHRYPFVIRCGGMLTALGPRAGTKAVHPKTGAITLSCPGFNDKNDYDRQTPCDQDFLRKLARDTRADELFAWYNRDVARVLGKHKAFDPEGIFIGDASYLFVPDNEAYEGSVVMLFDKHNHPVDPKQVSQERMVDCQWRRCYKMVSLLHGHRDGNYFVVAAVKVLPGSAHECPVLYEMVEDFTAAAGEGVIRRLILDRGFIDGEKIGRCKLEHGIDVLIPVRRDMDIYDDVMGLLPGMESRFETVREPAEEAPQDSPPKPERVRKREASRRKKLEEKKAAAPPPPPEKTIVCSQVVKLPELRSWDACPVPLNVVVCRDTYADGHSDVWMLIDTDPKKSPSQSRNDYTLRAQIEERHRQLKCFSDLSRFTSRAFSMVANQVVFVLLTYTLLQIFLHRSDMKDMGRRLMANVQRKLLPAASFVIVYCQNKVAFMPQIHFADVLINLEEEARLKARAKIKKLRLEFDETLYLPRPP